MINKRKISFDTFRLFARFTRFIYPFRSGFPLYKKQLSCQPFFIVGSGRSGNTLVRRMLMAGEEVSIPPESYILPRAARKFLMYNYLPWNELAALIVAEFESHPEFSHWQLPLLQVQLKARALKGKERSFANIIDLVFQQYAIQQHMKKLPWGDKTPGNALFLDHICSAFPEAKYIHLIRDPRAVFASYVSSGILPATTIAEKNDIITLWLDSHQKIEKCKRQFDSNQFIEVHYESLVKQPELQLKTICQHLNIQFKQTMLDYWQKKPDGDMQALQHHANTANPVSDSSLNKWRELVSHDELMLIEKRCLPYYQKLLDNYPL